MYHCLGLVFLITEKLGISFSVYESSMLLLMWNVYSNLLIKKPAVARRLRGWHGLILAAPRDLWLLRGKLQAPFKEWEPSLGEFTKQHTGQREGRSSRSKQGDHLENSRGCFWSSQHPQNCQRFKMAFLNFISFYMTNNEKTLRSNLTQNYYGEKKRAE